MEGHLETRQKVAVFLPHFAQLPVWIWVSLFVHPLPSITGPSPFIHTLAVLFFEWIFPFRLSPPFPFSFFHSPHSVPFAFFAFATDLLKMQLKEGNCTFIQANLRFTSFHVFFSSKEERN